LTIVGAAVLLRVVYDPWYLNFDARYALDWAHDLWHGYTPDFTAPYASTPHPLSNAISSLALVFGDSGDQLIVWLVLLGFGATVWLAYLLGKEIFSPAVGVVTALVVLTRPALQRDAVLGYQDVWFEMVVLTALLLEVRRPRRGLAVLALLAVAGVLRPDAWVLSGLYWIYLWRTKAAPPRRLAAYAALVAVGPVAWALADLAVTGDALHSLHGTSHLAEEAGRRRHLVQAPRWTLQYLAFVLREPILVGLPIGLYFAWKHKRRESVLPIAAAVAILLVFAAGPLFGLPLIGRYVRTPAILLALFYGLAVMGWQLLPEGESRRRWMWAGGAAALFSVIFLPWHFSMLHNLYRTSHRNGKFYADLRTAARAPAVKSAFAACGRFSTADHRPVPYLRYWLHGKPNSVGTIEKHTSPLAQLLLVPRRTKFARRFYLKNFPHVKPPPGWSTIYQNRSWRVYEAPGACTTRSR
jgi:hypothetical protein